MNNLFFPINDNDKTVYHVLVCNVLRNIMIILQLVLLVVICISYTG